MSDQPPLDAQEDFWDSWNAEWRFGGIDEFMAAQRREALRVAARLPHRPLRILEAGCGTGWLSNELSSVGSATGVDLSPASIELGKQRFPGVDLRCGDFLTMPLDGPFELIVSADAIAHMYEQDKYVARIAGLLAPGGTFLLMTQNRFVWNRRSRHRAYGGGQIEQWPSLRRIRELLGTSFTIERIGSIDPGGDRGVLFWVENRYVRGGMRRLVGANRWRAALERVRLGRELVIVATATGRR